MTDLTRFTMYWRKESYSLRAGILVWYFTFYAWNSKPDCMLAGITSNVIIRPTLCDTLGKVEWSVFAVETCRFSTYSRCLLLETKFTLYWRKKGYSLRAGILVWNFTFHARNSKPESLLNRTTTWFYRYTYIIWQPWSVGSTYISGKRGVFLQCTNFLVLLTDLTPVNCIQLQNWFQTRFSVLGRVFFFFSLRALDGR